MLRRSLFVMTVAGVLVGCGNQAEPSVPAEITPMGAQQEATSAAPDAVGTEATPAAEATAPVASANGEDLSTEAMFGANIPLPPGANPVETELSGPNVASVVFEVAGMNAAEVMEFFQDGMIAAGFTLTPQESADATSTTWGYEGNGVSGTLIVMEGEAGGAPRFRIIPTPQ